MHAESFAFELDSIEISGDGNNIERELQDPERYACHRVIAEHRSQAGEEVRAELVEGRESAKVVEIGEMHDGEMLELLRSGRRMTSPEHEGRCEVEVAIEQQSRDGKREMTKDGGGALLDECQR